MSNPSRTLSRNDRGERRSLSFADNFESFQVDADIPAASELAIKNQFKNGKIPSGYLIFSHSGQGQVRKGDTDWTSDFVYLQNIHATEDLSITVRFFK